MMVQYFGSNFTFFFSLTWLYPYVKTKYNLTAVDAGFYAMMPLLGGAVGNIFSGWLVDFLYRRGQVSLSRKIPAIAGFLLAALGMVMSLQQATAVGAVFWLTIAIFGADMTLSPSWSFCIDIGGKHAGAVSGTMNMAGNLGSAITALAFAYLPESSKGNEAFFYTAAALSGVAIVCWLLANPGKKNQPCVIELKLLTSLVSCGVLFLCLPVGHAAGWETVPCEPVCTARHEAAMTALNGKLYLLGGRGVKPVEEYDPAANAWKKLSPTPMQIHHFQALVVADRIALVGAMTGGYPKEPAVPNVWWFDPAKDEWTKGPAMPAGRERGGAGTVLHDNKIYLVWRQHQRPLERICALGGCAGFEDRPMDAAAGCAPCPRSFSSGAHGRENCRGGRTALLRRDEADVQSHRARGGRV